MYQDLSHYASQQVNPMPHAQQWPRTASIPLPSYDLDPKSTPQTHPHSKFWNKSDWNVWTRKAKNNIHDPQKTVSWGRKWRTDWYQNCQPNLWQHVPCMKWSCCTKMATIAVHEDMLLLVHITTSICTWKISGHFSGYVVVGGNLMNQYLTSTLDTSGHTLMTRAT